MRNVLFYKNRSEQGGAIANWASMRIVNGTIADNEAEQGQRNQ